jgi:predicted CopG family antitoxin
MSRSRKTASIAKTIKISDDCWDKLRRLKLDDLSKESYTSVLVFIWERVKDFISNQDLKINLDKFLRDEERTYNKTVVIHVEAHKILTTIKYDYNLKTLSDAIDLLIEEYNMRF